MSLILGGSDFKSSTPRDVRRYHGVERTIDDTHLDGQSGSFPLWLPSIQLPKRFPTAAHLASYAGLVPRVQSSGGHTRMGQVCGNVNRNLKWAFVETGNLIVLSQRRFAGTHVVRLYQRIKRTRNHQKGSSGCSAPLGRGRLVGAH